MEEKKSTIHDIARELKVTASTVSRALNDNPRISEEMRRTVKAMAVRMDYEHNHIAAALRSGKTRIVGVIVPTANRSFFASVVRGIEAVTNEAGYNVIISQSNDDYAQEVSIIDTLLRLRVDGIIASISRETSTFDHFHKVREKGVPLVLFDRVTEDLGGSTIAVDDYIGAVRAVEHLIQQGYRRIAHFAGPQNLNIYRNRYQGYRDALEAAGFPFDPALVPIGPVALDDGRQYMTRLLELPEPPDAIFSASDYAALGAMQVLKEHKIGIPEQVGLVGFANEAFTSYVEPGLSSVNQHSERMGEFAARIFLEQVQAPKDKPFMPRKTVLTPELVLRGSSMRG